MTSLKSIYGRMITTPVWFPEGKGPNHSKRKRLSLLPPLKGGPAPLFKGSHATPEKGGQALFIVLKVTSPFHYPRFVFSVMYAGRL